MAQPKSVVGLDVHATKTQAAVLHPETGELRSRRLSGPPRRALDFLTELPAPVLAVYEAGPTGYGLARGAAEWGLDVRVCAPGSIPRAPGDRVKTDRRDAERLARLLLAGELSFVRVPSPEEESFRDLTRAREAIRADLMRARHRVGKLLLRRELRWEGPGSAWTQAHWRWLDATADVGPGSLNLLTGNLTISRTDVSLPSFGSDLEFARTGSSRVPRRPVYVASVACNLTLLGRGSGCSPATRRSEPVGREEPGGGSRSSTSEAINWRSIMQIVGGPSFTT